MNELIKVTNNEYYEQVVEGRDLHNILKIDTPYHIWFNRICEYGFVENVDFISFELNCSKPKGGRPSYNHMIKIDMAKEIYMLSRSNKGKEIRQYFIQLEKDWNSPEKVMARALKIAERTIENLKDCIVQKDNLIEEQKPMVEFSEKLLKSTDNITIGEFFKDNAR